MRISDWSSDVCSSDLFIGDSIVDVLTARAAAVPVITVAFGFADRPADELGGDVLIHHSDELVPALREIRLPDELNDRRGACRQPILAWPDGGGEIGRAHV